MLPLYMTFWVATGTPGKKSDTIHGLKIRSVKDFLVHFKDINWYVIQIDGDENHINNSPFKLDEWYNKYMCGATLNGARHLTFAILINNHRRQKVFFHIHADVHAG